MSDRPRWQHRSTIVIVPQSESEILTRDTAMNAARAVESLPKRLTCSTTDKLIYRGFAAKLRYAVGRSIVHHATSDFNLPLPEQEEISKQIAKSLGPIHGLSLIMIPSETGPVMQRCLVGENFVRRIKTQPL